jgi:hypothetical protein
MKNHFFKYFNVQQSAALLSNNSPSRHKMKHDGQALPLAEGIPSGPARRGKTYWQRNAPKEETDFSLLRLTSAVSHFPEVLGSHKTNRNNRCLIGVTA